MYLKRIRLRNWKLYGGEHEFEFPEPGRQKNVVLIGAKNGYGKTSLLEAIVLGLYGRDGLDIVARADGMGDENRRRQSYRKFIEAARHDRAAIEGDSTTEVELLFEDPADGTSIGIRRTWTFGVNGLLGNGEEVAIEADGERQSAGRNEDEEDFARGWIAKAALPAHLAQFFLFDGERVQKLAERDMATQVRLGIEGFLGVKLMRDLATDLAHFASTKRGEVKGADEGLVGELRRAVADLDAETRATKAELVEIERRLSAAEAESEQLQARLSSMGGGSAKSVGRLAEQKAAVKRTYDKLTAELTDLVGGDFAFALCGPGIRGRLMERLVGEQKLAASLAAIESSKGRIGRFVEALKSVEPGFAPPLSSEQERTLEQKIAGAWHSIWHPPEDGCAPEFRHTALSDHDRAKVLERLESSARLGEDGIADLIHQLNKAAEEHDRLQAQINTFMGIENQLDEVSGRLAEVSRVVGEASRDRADRERRLQALEVERNNKYASLQSQQAALDEARPVLAKAEVAERIQSIIQPFIDEAVGGLVSDIAEKMTAAFKEMAHKTYVHRIEIDRDCTVRLLSKYGEDIRSLNQSAGENQLFAFALISALAQAAQIRFPLVVDTPLARLDARHRTNVLKHFTQNAGDQIIFLSQDTEVVREFKEAIAPRIKQTFLIENEARPGSKAGRAVVRQSDYF